ncbi:hypothetical protein [Candidatus Electrothrix sp.]|uniref:hypothetical protein n=1 Tax=Candidatus Electrothrix sp. TaxID=2170559 RepID=UPI004055FE0A
MPKDSTEKKTAAYVFPVPQPGKTTKQESKTRKERCKTANQPGKTTEQHGKMTEEQRKIVQEHGKTIKEYCFVIFPPSAAASQACFLGFPHCCPIATCSSASATVFFVAARKIRERDRHPLR